VSRGVSTSDVAPRSTGGAGELGRFAAVGLAAYLTDVAVFNALLVGGGTTSAWAKVLSSIVGIAVAFLGSRHYTWPERKADSPWREYALFVLFSVLAAGIQLACLLVSHHLLDLRSTLADNVSANVIGMGLATVFRFWTFRTYVFPERPVVTG